MTAETNEKMTQEEVLVETPVKEKKSSPKKETKLSKEGEAELKKGGDIRDALREKFSEVLESYKNIDKRIKIHLVDEDTLDVDFTVLSKAPYDNKKQNINYRYINNGFRIILGVDGLGKGEVVLRRNNKNNGSTKVVKKLIAIEKKEISARCNEVIEEMFTLASEAVVDAHKKYNMKKVEEIELYLKHNSVGVFTDIPETVYHAIRTAESNSSTVGLDETYNHYTAYKENGGIKKTEAMVLGSLAHMNLLEPKRFKEETYHTDCGHQKTEDKMHHRIFSVSKVGKVSLSTKQEGVVNVMSKNLKAHPVLNLIHKESKFEVTLFYKILNTQYRSRLDGVIENPSDELVKAIVAMRALPYPEDIIKNSVIVWDYKSTMNASPKEFVKDIRKKKYNVQGGGYVEAVKQNYGKNVIYIIVAGEKVVPFQVDYHVLHENDLDHGLKTLVKRTMKLEEHLADPSLYGGYPFIGKEFAMLPSWGRDDDLDDFEIENDDDSNQESA